MIISDLVVMNNLSSCWCYTYAIHTLGLCAPIDYTKSNQPRPFTVIPANLAERDIDSLVGTRYFLGLE